MSQPRSTAAPSGAEIRDLKARAQHLEPVVYLGKAGLTTAFLEAVAAALVSHELIKVKFTAEKPRRHELADEIAQATDSTLVTVVGHVAVFYRPRPQPTAPRQP